MSVSHRASFWGDLRRGVSPHPPMSLAACRGARNSACACKGRRKRNSMNESPLKVFLFSFSLQLKVLQSRSCVRLELSPRRLAWPGKPAVSPARLVPTAGRRVSQPRLDPALRVSASGFTGPISAVWYIWMRQLLYLPPSTLHCVFFCDRLLVSSRSGCSHSFSLPSRPFLLAGQCGSGALSARILSGQRETGNLRCLWGG